MKKVRNLEAATELLEFGMQVKYHGLREIIAPEALMAMFLLFGKKMWVVPAPASTDEEKGNQ